ncbi:hypothetical protein, partial [Proteus mirabilis]|uniref:hypothetical protein n=4 Tax=Proteus TaxID=583 RepID=UPI00195493B8
FIFNKLNKVLFLYLAKSNARLNCINLSQIAIFLASIMLGSHLTTLLFTFLSNKMLKQIINNLPSSH